MGTHQAWDPLTTPLAPGKHLGPNTSTQPLSSYLMSYLLQAPVCLAQ